MAGVTIPTPIYHRGRKRGGSVGAAMELLEFNPWPTDSNHYLEMRLDNITSKGQSAEFYITGNIGATDVSKSNGYLANLQKGITTTTWSSAERGVTLASFFNKLFQMAGIGASAVSGSPAAGGDPIAYYRQGTAQSASGRFSPSSLLIFKTSSPGNGSLVSSGYLSIGVELYGNYSMTSSDVTINVTKGNINWVDETGYHEWNGT